MQSLIFFSVRLTFAEYYPADKEWDYFVLEIFEWILMIRASFSSHIVSQMPLKIFLLIFLESLLSLFDIFCWLEIFLGKVITFFTKALIDAAWKITCSVNVVIKF